MKTNHHFWSLLKYEFSTSSFMVWLCGGYMFFFAFFPRNFLDDATHSFTFFEPSTLGSCYFILFVGAIILTPWLMQSAWQAGSEYYPDYRNFFFSRAIDRTTIFRAKSSLFLFISLSASLLILGLSFRNPDIIVSPDRFISDQTTSKYQERFHKVFPNSHMLKDEGSGRYGAPTVHHKGDIAIPYGRLLISAWILWKVFLLSMLAQAFVMGISGLRHRKLIFWIPFMVMVISLVGPTFFPISTISTNGTHWFECEENFSENFFLFFAGHWLLFSLCALVLGTVLQTFCERKFRKMEVTS